MKHLIVQKIIAIVLFVFPEICLSSEVHICPEKVQLSAGSFTVTNVPAGFKSVISNSPIRLTGINMFDGPPEEEAALLPTKENGDVSVWKFEGTYESGKWLSCDYVEGLIRVTTRVADTSVQCSVTAKKSGSPLILRARFVCK